MQRYKDLILDQRSLGDDKICLRWGREIFEGRGRREEMRILKSSFHMIGLEIIFWGERDCRDEVFFFSFSLFFLQSFFRMLGQEETESLLASDSLFRILIVR